MPCLLMQSFHWKAGRSKVRTRRAHTDAPCTTAQVKYCTSTMETNRGCAAVATTAELRTWDRFWATAATPTTRKPISCSVKAVKMVGKGVIGWVGKELAPRSSL